MDIPHLFIYLSVTEHLGYSHPGAIINNTAMNMFLVRHAFYSWVYIWE